MRVGGLYTAVCAVKGPALRPRWAFNAVVPISPAIVPGHCTASAAATGCALVGHESGRAGRPASEPQRSPGIALIGSAQGRGDARAQTLQQHIAVCDVAEIPPLPPWQICEYSSSRAVHDFRKAERKKDVIVHARRSLARSSISRPGRAGRTSTPRAAHPHVDEEAMVKAVRNIASSAARTQQRSNKLSGSACELVRKGRNRKLTQVTVSFRRAREGPFSGARARRLSLGFCSGRRRRGTISRSVDIELPFGAKLRRSRTDWARITTTSPMGTAGRPPTEIQARRLPSRSPGRPTPVGVEARLWATGVKKWSRPRGRPSVRRGSMPAASERGQVEGKNGWIWVNRTRSTRVTRHARHDDDRPGLRIEVSDDHMANFFNAVRTRKDPISPVEDGHRSANIGHLIVIALRTGRTLHWDAAKEKFVGEGNKELNAHLARRMRKPYDYSFAG